MKESLVKSALSIAFLTHDIGAILPEVDDNSTTIRDSSRRDSSILPIQSDFIHGTSLWPTKYFD